MPSSLREENLEGTQPTTTPSGDEMGTLDDTNVAKEGVKVDPVDSREEGRPTNLTNEVEVEPEIQAADLGYPTGGQSGAKEAPPSTASSGQAFDVNNAAVGLEPYIPGTYREDGEPVEAGSPQFSDQHGGGGHGGGEVDAESSHRESATAQLDVMDGAMKPMGNVDDEEHGGVQEGGAGVSADGEDKAAGRGGDAGGMKFGASGADGRARRERSLFEGSRIEEQLEEGQVVDARDGADVIPGVDDLPIFANEQSKALNDEIKVMRKRKSGKSCMRAFRLQ